MDLMIGSADVCKKQRQPRYGQVVWCHSEATGDFEWRRDGWAIEE